MKKAIREMDFSDDLAKRLVGNSEAIGEDLVDDIIAKFDMIFITL